MRRVQPCLEPNCPSGTTIEMLYTEEKGSDVNEGPGEVRCHNVDLNGGLWWVIGPDGARRP